jgi:AraC family transcriptional regulator of adaptative response / DNA-3-methyladenine glycosylase II
MTTRMDTPTASERRLHDERYRIVSARDRRFDGQFVMAVHSTGIYCRPSCPARTPRRDGVSFYTTSAAAQRAGYRACKRCLPEATPGSPEWNLREDTAARAMRLVLDGCADREGVTGLARRLGYSPRQLDRILVAELGAGPKALARAHRVQAARELLTSTDLSVADVAFAAGFGSVRQCNGTVRDVFGLTPTGIRLRRRTRRADGRGAADEDGALRLWLPAREPFDAAGLLAWLEARAIPGLEAVSAAGYERVVRLVGGPAWFRALPSAGGTARGDRAGVDLRVRLNALSDLPALVAHVRSLFDLDADPVAADAVLSALPELRASVAATPGIRVPGAADAHELVVRAIVGQQVSVAAARTALARFVAELGDPVPDHIAPGFLLFPAMATVAERGARVLRGPGRRVAAVVRTAAALGDGALVVDRGQSLGELQNSLQRMPGIGPWTAGYIGLRVRQHPDVLLPGDAGVRSGARALGLPDAAPALERWAERAAPWRSYLTLHLWRAAAAATPAPGARPARTARWKASTPA